MASALLPIDLVEPNRFRAFAFETMWIKWHRLLVFYFG
jgi:hypothetical protein